MWRTRGRPDGGAVVGEGPFRITLQRHFRSAGTARAHVRTHCAQMPVYVSATAELLASELVANAVAHGEGLIELRMSVADEVLRVEVSDESPLEPRLGAPGPQESEGRGLQFVDAYALSWGTTMHVERPGKTVWFTLRVG